jgi:hypothetical protein
MTVHSAPHLTTPTRSRSANEVPCPGGTMILSALFVIQATNWSEHTANHTQNGVG